MSELAYTHSFTADLTRPLRPVTLPDAVPAGDSAAHRFLVTMTAETLPQATAYALRPDGITVVIPCETGEDALCFTLPAEALAEPGSVSVLLRAHEGDTLTTLLWCRLTVAPGLTDELCDPSGMVPSLEELLDRLADCEAAAAQARQAAAEVQEQVDAAAASAEAANSAAAAMSEQLTPVLTRLDDIE